MADIVTSTYDLVITTEMARGRNESSTRTFSFPVSNGTPLSDVRSVAADLENSLLGGYSTVFQPTTWRDEDIEEDEYQIIAASSELIQKTTTKIDTSGEVVPTLIVGAAFINTDAYPQAFYPEDQPIVITKPREEFLEEGSSFFSTEIYEWQPSPGYYEHTLNGIEESKFTVTGGSGNDYLNLTYEYNDTDKGIVFTATAGTSTTPAGFTVTVEYENARSFTLTYQPAT